jgi:hypothetical protein
LLVSCGGNGGSSSGSRTSPNGGGTGGTGGTVTSFMGSNKVLIGGSFGKDAAGNDLGAAAPFDVRYAYLDSPPASSSTYYTASLCQAAWTNWWGCWSGNTTAPGATVTYWDDYVATQVKWQGKSRPQIFFWTWYMLRPLGTLAGKGDGPSEVAAIDDAALLTLYMDDYRFFLQKIGNSRTMIDLEPDFWGFAQSLQNGNPHLVPAKVSTANPTDCATQEDSAAGLARCLISMARKYAPNTAVGMHLSCFNWQADTKGCGQYYVALGATDADFLAGDVSDRDAGWYALPANGGSDNFWTDQNQKGATALAFYKTITEAVGKPLVLWQIPLGNMAQNNTLNHYQDDKVDYFFSHMSQVADAHVVGLLFGAGQQDQTSAETDGGNLINKAINYWNTGGIQIR